MTGADTSSNLVRINFLLSEPFSFFLHFCHVFIFVSKIFMLSFLVLREQK